MTPIRYSPRTGTMAEDPQGDYIEYPSWRPIATAPTRRRVLVGYRNTYGRWRTAIASYYTADDIAEWENADLCDPGWYERSYAHEAESELVFALEGSPTHWQELPGEPSA